MQTALCTLDHSHQNPWQFASLSPHVLEQRREFLVCPGCGGSAYFRSGSRNGRAPCFCGHHDQGCRFAATPSGIKDPDRSRHQSPFAQQRIAVDFSYGTALPGDGDWSGDFEEQQDERARSSGMGDGGNAVVYRRLRSILRDLFMTALSASHQSLQVTGYGDTTPAQFFIRFDRVSDRHTGQFHGFWGQMSCARTGPDGELWLNTGDRGDLSICVPQHLVPALRRRFTMHDKGEWTGHGLQVLVFGVLQIKADSAKPYIVVADLSLIALHEPSAF